MEQSLYSQLVEPLVHIITVKPSDNKYHVSLFCQEQALTALKTITKRSLIFDDSNLLQLIIDRLKIELQILREDLSGQPCQWKANKPNDDIDFNTCKLEKRQKFIKDCFGLLCYAVIRIDPTRLNQNQNFIAHSRKILESNLFEECLMDFVFLQNQEAPSALYSKIVDPIFMECVQLYTIIGNDLPQKIGDLIDSGLIPCILNSLDRRIPIQNQMLQVVIKFFKMLNLSTKGTEALLASQALERFFELGQDYRSYKMFVMPRGSNPMFDQRQLINNFANLDQQIANRIYAQCLLNLTKMQERSWDLCREFLQMETDIDNAGAVTDAEKAPFRNPYGKKQINYEQALEASVALLSCFCMDELEYLENVQTHNSCVMQSIKARDETEIVLKLLRTPIICSAADGFIYHFQESATLILMLQNGLPGFEKYLETLVDYLKQSFSDLYTILGTQDLDSLMTIETTKFVDLAEETATDAQRESLKQLKQEDVVWVAISKIHMLIEMIIILGTLSKFHDQLGVFSHYTQFINKFLAMPIGGYQCIAKLQHLLHRYYSNVYVEQVQAQFARKDRILDQFRPELEKFIWGSFRELDEPYSDLEDARNIYYRYELQTVDSLEEKKAEDLTRLQFEFVLPENKGVIQTFKCYKKIKNLMGQLAGMYNKRRYHFKDPLQPQQIVYNQVSAEFAADQLRLIASRCTSTEFDVEQTLRTALLIDRILPDLSRQIGYKWKNQLNGIFLFSLLNQEAVVDVVGMILEWAVLQYVSLQEQEGKKILFHARNIQIIIRECVHFLMTLLKVTYLCNGNLQTYLAYFRRDKSTTLFKQEISQYFPKCFTLAKNLLYKCVLLPMTIVMFSPQRQCLNNWRYFGGGIAENVIKVYSNLCQGAFKDPFDFFADQNIHKQIQSDMPIRNRRQHRCEGGQELADDVTIVINPDLIQQLIQMGFTEAAASAALRKYGNDFEFSLEALLLGEFVGTQPVVPTTTPEAPVVPTESPLKIDMTGLLMYEADFGPETEPETLKRICTLLQQTFIPCISTCLSKSPINQKRSLINKLFSFYKDFKQPKIIQDLIAQLAQEMLTSSQIPDWFFVCYTIQLLQYAKEPFVQSLNLTQTFMQLIDRLKLQALNANQWTKLKPKILGNTEDSKDLATDKILDDSNEALYNIHVHLSLLYFLLTDFHSQQELAILEQLINPVDIEDKSAFEEPVTYQDIETIKLDALFTTDHKEGKEPVSLIASEVEREIIVKAAYQAVMQLLGSFAGVEYSLVLQTKQAVQHMLGPCLKVLKMISNLQFPDFDFRQSFLKDNGLKTLFEMNIIDTDFQAKRSNWATDRHVEVDLKDLIDNVWQPPKDLQKWYETLIQRQMFFQFKANFKRRDQQKDPCDYIISGLDLPLPKSVEFQEQEIGASTKKKQPMPAVQQPFQKRNKSQAKINDEPSFQIPSQKDLKRLLKKYEDLNEQSFSEFVKYYNSNIFQHVIVHFNTFLAACAKTCVIKKVPKTTVSAQVPAEESKDQQFELKIMLKKSLLMSMIVDPNFNYSLPQKLPLKPKPDNVTKNQNEIVNQLLEIFIAQTKGYRMDILKQLRETKLSEQSCLQITDSNKLCLNPVGQERRIYFLDHVNLLRALATIIGKNNSVVGLIYKHNDSKTVKFIVRNVYYLLSLHVDSEIKELQMNLNIPFERQTYVISFFVHLLLLNHGSSVQDRALKKELGLLFIRQLAKSLTFKTSNESLWSTSSQLLQKFSSIWILGKFLLMKSFDTNTKDALGAICQKKTKFQRLQRNNMVKQLIIQCNQLMPSNQVFAESGTFALLECIQNASIALQTPDLYLFGQSKNQCLSLCVSVITKVLRLFENSQSLGKFFKTTQGDHNTPLDYSSANEPSDLEMRDGDLDHDDDESGEDDGYGSFSDSDSDGDFPTTGDRQQPIGLADLLSDDEEMEEGEDEDVDYGSEEGEEESEEGWEIEAIEEAEVEMTELLNSQQISAAENPQTGQKQGGPPPPQSSSSSEHGMNDDDDPEDDDEENSWEDGHMNQEQISYQDQESEYDDDEDNADEYDSYEDGDSMNSREGLSYEQEGDSEVEYEPQPSRRQNRTDRRAFILSQSHVSQQRQVMSPEFQMNFINNNDHFNLEDNAIQGGRGGLPMMTSLSSDLQRIIYQNADILSSTLNDQFMHLMDRNNKDGTSLGGGFILAIGLRKQQISVLREKIKITEGFYQQIITTFMAAPIQVQPKPANSATADSSDVIRINPSDYKDHMKPQVQLPSQSQQKSNQPNQPTSNRNPLVIEGMDPLFMESLSAIGLQNIADSHQIHAQLTQQQQPMEMMQDFARFMRSQTQQRRQDILRQIQSDQCRDLPSEIFAEMRELYVQDRESFMRVLNHPPASRPQPPIRTQEILQAPPVPPRDRLMSQDSITMSLDLYGPADSQTIINKATEANKQPQVETIRGDQFVQNFFIVLQDMNARYEREPQVVQCDRQAEGILQHALIPLPTDTAQVQYAKIKGTVETAQTAFMNLDLSADTQLTQSIKILHRIPNIRICLILKVVKQGHDEIIRAKRHCEEQIQLKQQKPYHTKLVFSENQDSMIPFANTVIGALKTTTQLQTSIDNEEATGREVMEIVQPLQHDQLICKFAQMIGLEDLSKSIVEYLLDLMLEFWDLCHENPWVINSNEQAIQMEIQSAVMEQIFHLLQPVMKEVKAKDHKLELPLTKLCKVFLNRHLPLVKKSLTQVCATLNDFSDLNSIEVIQKFLETKVRNLLVQNMESLQSKLSGQETESLQIESTVEIFKVTQQLKCLKTKNVCEETLMLQVFQQASEMVKSEELRCIKAQKDSMFVFREEVKDLLNLVFSLCEYNLKLIFAKKETTKDKPETDLLQIQSIDKSILQTKTVDRNNKEEPKSFMALLESHLAQSSPDFKRFQTIMQFLVDNKKLINKFIQLNHSVINKELIQVALMIPSVLDFDTKRAIWKTELKRMQSKYKNERFQFQIRREHTLQDSYAVMQGLQTKQWRGRMQVEFTGEDGIDEGGLFKEWISNLCKELFNEDMALFIKAASGSTYYPNPQSTVQPNYNEMFTFAGKFVGKALWDFQLLDCYFVKAFYKIMLGMPLTYHDLEDYDSSLYNSLNWMMENQGVESICSSFVETIEYFGEQKEIELCEGGKDITVTDENKYDYVQQVANYRLYKAISTQIDAFLKGLYSVIPQETLKIFDNRELELLISGLQIIDIDDLRENTLYQNYTAQSKPVQYLFEALQEFDNLERAEFIRFVTGSSKVPVEGFKGLRAVHGVQKFTVVKIPSTTQGRLPQSHTCMNQLDLPEYQDKETCKKMLLYAIKEGKTFGFA